MKFHILLFILIISEAHFLTAISLPLKVSSIPKNSKSQTSLVGFHKLNFESIEKQLHQTLFNPEESVETCRELDELHPCENIDALSVGLFIPQEDLFKIDLYAKEVLTILDKVQHRYPFHLKIIVQDENEDDHVQELQSVISQLFQNFQFSFSKHPSTFEILRLDKEKLVQNSSPFQLQSSKFRIDNALRKALKSVIALEKLEIIDIKSFLTFTKSVLAEVSKSTHPQWLKEHQWQMTVTYLLDQIQILVSERTLSTFKARTETLSYSDQLQTKLEALYESTIQLFRQTILKVFREVEEALPECKLRIWSEQNEKALAPLQERLEKALQKVIKESLDYHKLEGNFNPYLRSNLFPPCHINVNYLVELKDLSVRFNSYDEHKDGQLTRNRAKHLEMPNLIRLPFQPKGIK